MFRHRLRAAARLKNSTSEKRTSFWQNVFLVVIGALISFLSSVTTNYFNSRNEDRKVALGQKVLFEKDVVNCVAQNLTLHKDLFDSELGSQVEVDRAKRFFLRTRREWRNRVQSVKLLMHSYVDPSICSRFRKQDDSLAALYDTIYSIAVEEFFHRAEVSEDFDRRRKEYSYKFDSSEAVWLDFMKDFHAAIMK